MKNLTTEQKRMEREYNRMQSVIDHATKGQQLMRPINGKYSEFQHAAYATYQGHINAAQCRMRQLEEIVKEQA
jgi:hypothetical protein